MSEPTTPKKHTVLYARISNNGTKITGQVGELKGYCEKNNWKNIKVFKELPNKQIGSRPKLDELFEFCKTKSVERVVVQDLSRLSRKSVGDVVATISALQKKGISIVSVNEKLELEAKSSKMMISMLKAFSNIEQEIRKESPSYGKASDDASIKGQTKENRETKHDKEIFKLRKKNFTIRKISEILGLDRETVQRSANQQKL